MSYAFELDQPMTAAAVHAGAVVAGALLGLLAVLGLVAFAVVATARGHRPKPVPQQQASPASAQVSTNRTHSRMGRLVPVLPSAKRADLICAEPSILTPECFALIPGPALGDAAGSNDAYVDSETAAHNFAAIDVELERHSGPAANVVIKGEAREFAVANPMASVAVAGRMSTPQLTSKNAGTDGDTTHETRYDDYDYRYYGSQRIAIRSSQRIL